jgi:LPS-assembly protein
MRTVRRSAATAAFASLVLGLPAWPQGGGPAALLAGPPGQEVEIEADKATYGWEKRLLELEGHVVARRGDGVLRASSGTLDREHGTLALSGGVLGVQGRHVFLADAALVNLDGRSADLQGAVLYLKEKPAVAANPTSGRNSLILHGARVQQLSRDEFLAHDVTLTPCDCPGEPDYELLATTARIDEDRAHLVGTRLRLMGATMPLFPLSLPLTQRQSGLLAPQLGFASAFGFGYSQPVFITLGRSNDITLSPGLFTGTSHTYEPTPGRRTIRGPRLGAEWRYAPVEGTSGAVSVDLFYDFDKGDSRYHDPADPSATVVPPLYPGEHGTDPGRGFGGIRGVAHVAHRSEGDLGTFAVQGTAATDSMVLADSQPASLESTLDLLRTDLGAWRASGPLTLGADATLLQDVRYRGDYPDRRLFGPERRSTFQRLPALFGQLAPVPLGPLVLSAEASAVQFAAFAGPDAEERATGFGPTDRGASASLPVIPGNAARAPALRFDVSPRISVSGPADLALDLRLEAGARADAWMLEGFSDRNRARLYALLGARAALPLERAFGGALHRIEPSIEVRALSRPLQSGGPPIGDPADGGGAIYLPFANAAEQGLAPGLPRRDSAITAGVPAMRRPYDEIDGAAPSTGEVEATFGFSQSLWTKSGASAVRLIRLDLLQDALLWSQGAGARLGEASAVLSALLGPASLTGVFRFDWTLRTVSVAGLTASLRDSRGDEIHAGGSVLATASSERLRSGIDELFSAVRLATGSGDLSGSAGAGVSAPVPIGRQGLRLAYEASHFVLPSGAQPPANLGDWTHSVRAAYETPCRCAGVQLSADFHFLGGSLLGGPTIRFVLDLKSLGSFGTF